MTYAIVAETQGLTVFNRARSAAEALELAIVRRRGGADAVYVRDEAWSLVSAAVLEDTVARDRRQQPPPSPVTTTLKLDGSVLPAPGRDEPPPARTGRVRVFKAAGLQRSRG